ncbi:MAG TPA: D-aminoacylase [Pyrinomonadaceae bacterium]|jgi:N-acyl-D-amino-acid deacylase
MRRVSVATIVLLLITASFISVTLKGSVSVNQESSQPIVISGATLIDGSGRAPVADSVVVMKGDSILAAGKRSQVQVPAGARVIEARGLVVAPGFIDAHNHSDRGFATDPSAASQVSQGITTVVIGQDGGSAFPIGEYLAELDKNPIALNVLTFVGHATLRSRVMGDDTNRLATPAEIEKMRQMVEQAMNDGAMGLSTGLEYETGKPASTEEVITLASAAGAYGGIYISHIRDEADKSFEALAEAIQIGREARLPVQISHIKLATLKVWGKSKEVVALISKARARGQDVTADCYPYDAWSSTIRVLIPSGRYEDPVDVARGLADVGGPANITIVSCRAHPDYEFKTMAEISKQEKISPVELYMKIVREGGAGVVCHSMKEPDIRTFYTQPWVMVSSDGGIGSRHPRGAGTYPRVLGQYVREQRWLSLPEAIRKMTSFPASRFKLSDRGLIRAGFKADVVLFDPQQIIDRATFKDPQLVADGVKRVFVNGQEVWVDGNVTGKRPGHALRLRK